MKFVVRYSSWFCCFLLVACQLSPETPSLEGLGAQTRAIINGSPTLSHPAIGAIQADNTTFCSGTLIAKRLVLTAAHCIVAAQAHQKQKRALHFRVDQDSIPSFRSEYYAFQSFHIHPNYKRIQGTANNDLGLIVLKSRVETTPPLPLHLSKIDSTWQNKKVQLVGYGLIQTLPTQVLPKQKHTAELPIKNVLSDRFEVYMPGTSACSGDSGGPALHQLSGKTILVGVGSYITGTVLPDRALCNGSGFYFPLSQHQKWLLPLINKYKGSCATDADCASCYRCVQKQCQPKHSTATSSLCQGCKTPASCKGTGSLCVRRKEGNRCLQACDAQGCCPKGYVCQTVQANQKQCIPINNQCTAKCQKDDDCGPGEICKNQVCEPKPIPPSPKACQKCATSKDCTGGGTCIQQFDGGRCLQDCLFGHFCPSGFRCAIQNKRFLCLPSSGHCACQSDGDCHSPFTCQKTICQRPGGGKVGQACDKTHPCASGHHCLRTQAGQICIQTCQSSSSSCPTGFSCRDYGGQLKLCLPTGGQKAGEICGGNKLCMDGLICIAHDKQQICVRDCSKSQLCRPEGGRCTATTTSKLCLCEAGVPCRPGHTCKRIFGQSGICVQDASPTCQSDKDCPQGQTCNSGRCITESRQTCAEDSNCPPHQKCEKYYCVPRPPCTKDSECPPKAVCQQSKCVIPPPECTPQKPCPTGKICQQEKCIPDPNAQEPEPEAEPTPEDQAEPKKEVSPEPVTKDEVASQDAGGTDNAVDTAPDITTQSCGCSQGTPDNEAPFFLLILAAWLLLGIKSRISNVYR